jgi:hypothetical protein
VETPLELPERGSLGEEEKVRLAVAVRRAESCDRNGSSAQGVDEASPLMLATNPVARIPDVFEAGVGPQIINVPVRSLRRLLMVYDAGSDTSRAERAADVNVETPSKLQGAEFPDLDQLIPGTKKDQSIGAAFCCHVIARIHRLRECRLPPGAPAAS